jgi:hypothetical protein
MRSLLSFNPYSDDASAAGREGWRTVRDALRVYGATPASERFATALRANLAIVGDDPTGPYARRMFDGEGDGVRDDLRVLGVPESSWFWGEIILGQIRHLATQPKSVFLDRWEDLLEEAEWRPALIDRALALMLDRYVEVSTVENKRLTDLAFERWKNPLSPQHAGAWEARIKPRTYVVVTGWIKLSLIDDFFSLLADDKDADQARTKFWKGQIDQISSIHIFVGESGRTRTLDLRRRMGTSARLLRGNTHAFAMVIRGHVFIEFSNNGNALYAYPRSFLDELPAGYLDVSRDLKQRRTLTALRMANNWTHQGKWQTNFEARMRSMR